MKAAVYYETGPPDVFRYEDVPDPAVFPGGVLIEVDAISIEGGDTLNRAGGELTSKPHIVGYQCAGAIREEAEGVSDAHEGWVGEVRAATDGRGVDLVVDSVGGPVLAGSVQCLAYRGRCITVGNAGRQPQPLDVSMLMMGNSSLTGVFLGAEIANERTRAMIARHIEDVGSGRLQVLVDRTYPLSEAAAAHAYLESRQAVGRVVLIP